MSIRTPRRRDELSEKECNIEDTLVEYMVQDHGIYQGQVYADDFIELLEKRGYTIAKVKKSERIHQPA